MISTWDKNKWRIMFFTAQICDLSTAIVVLVSSDFRPHAKFHDPRTDSPYREKSKEVRDTGESY